MAPSSSAASGALTKHGFPRGYRFVPHYLEIVDLLAGRIAGAPLPPPLPGIFHDIRILDYHPRDLYEAYKEYEEDGCIYFFSRQEYPTPAGGRAGNAAGKKRRPVRAANGGGWKPSGGAKQLKRPRNKGGSGSVVVGRMVTMVFYERRRDSSTGEDKFVKTNWGMHEFTVPVKPDNKFSDIAVYRLYRVKNGNKENKQADGDGNEQAANAPDHGVVAPAAVAHEQQPPAWTAAGFPGAGTSTSNQALVAASTSQEHKPLSIGQIQHYYNHYAFAAAGMPGPSTWVPPATMPGPSSWMPPATTEMMPGSSSCWMPPAATNTQDHNATPVPSYIQFAAPSEQVNPGEQQPPAATEMHGGSSGTSSSPPPPHGQSAGCDETMEASVWDAPFDSNNYFMFDDGGDVLFSLEELTGITMEQDNPFGGDGDNHQLQF